MVTSQCLKTQNYVKLLQSLVFPFRSQPYFSKSTQIFWVSHFWCHDTHLPQPNVTRHNRKVGSSWPAASHEKLAAGMESDSPVRVEPHTRGSHRKHPTGREFSSRPPACLCPCPQPKVSHPVTTSGRVFTQKNLEIRIKTKKQTWVVVHQIHHQTFFLNIQCEVFHNWKRDSFTNWPSPL